MKGQAMVEFALILPLMLLLILGLFQVGLAQLTATRLTHAAQQAAIAGAAEPSVSDRCDTATVTASVIYGSTPDDTQCTQPGNVITVHLTDAAEQVGPWPVWHIEAIGRAVAP
jgi:Flp pilus assembly protein TadG